MTTADEDGFSLVVSPVQLAAVLEGHTLDRTATLSNQLWGGVTVVGGAIELVGSAILILVPEPTMATKVGGVVLATHGVDTVSTGLRQIFEGRPQTTMTAQAVAAAARSLGCKPLVADQVGMAVDIAVPLAAGFAGMLRVLAIRRGVMILEETEGFQGIRSKAHTIAEHVGKTEAELRARLVRQPWLTASSSFKSVESAGLAVSRGLGVNAKRIKDWSQAAHVGERMPPIIFDTGEVIGHGIAGPTRSFVQMTKVRIIIEKTASNNKIYFVLTAHPVL